MNPQQQLLASLPDDAIVARIKPHCKRRKQIVDRRSFLVEVGWYGQPPHGIAPGLRGQMERCVINELNPSSECVFEFRMVREARALENREQARKLQRGTAIQPVALPPQYENEAGMSTAELVAKEVAKALANQRGDIESHLAATLAAAKKDGAAELEEQLAAAKEEGAAEERKKLKAKRDAAKAAKAKRDVAAAEAAEPAGEPAADGPQPSSA